MTLRRTARRSIRQHAGLTAASTLKQVFGHDDFWPTQAEVIENVLRRRDTLAVMPTGGGKSVCYQLPALLFDGLTLVVSPLIALMQDQVDQLRQLGVAAAFLNSTLDYDSYLHTANRSGRGDQAALHGAGDVAATGDAGATGRKQAGLPGDRRGALHLAMGPRFSPRVPAVVGRAPPLSGTRSASRSRLRRRQRVQQDIQASLGFAAPKHVRGQLQPGQPVSCRAARVERPRPSQVLTFLQDAPRPVPGTRSSTAARGAGGRPGGPLATQAGRRCPTTPGWTTRTRQHNQRAFRPRRGPDHGGDHRLRHGHQQVQRALRRCTTTCPEIWNSYYQEIGRAGRDGLPADCLLLFSRGDMVTRSQLIDQGAPEEHAGRQARLQAMLRYAAESEACRRIPLLSYFGEQPTQVACGFCDNCLAARSEVEQITPPRPHKSSSPVSKIPARCSVSRIS